MAHAGLARGLVNKVGTPHAEQDDGSQYNPFLGYFSVAWMNNFQPAAQLAAATDCKSLIFSDTSSSVCDGGDGTLADCDMDDGASSCNTKGARCGAAIRFPRGGG